MSLLALTHAELGAAYPVASGNARFPHFAFGRLIGFTGGWVAFLGAVTVGPIMVEATLLYASNYISSLTTVSGGTHVLTAQGYVVAALLLLLFCTINVLGVRWLAKTTTIAACFKLLVPVLDVVGLLATSAHGENFTSAGGFMPYGWKGVFVALTSGGIVFAYLGFEQAVQLGGESRRPGRNIPIAIIGGMVVAVVLYVGLQVAFIAALNPSSLDHGWSAVSVSGKGAGTVRRARHGARARLARGADLLGRDRLARRHRAPVHRRERAPFVRARPERPHPEAVRRAHAQRNAVFAIAFSFLCGLFLFLPFPGWQQLVGFISGAAVIAYAMVPLSLGALRRQDPERTRPFRLPAASLLAPAAFVVANEILLFGGWAVVWKLIAAILIGYALLAVSRLTDRSARALPLDWRKRSVALAVPVRHGHDLVLQLVRHADAELDPAAGSPRAP